MLNGARSFAMSLLNPMMAALDSVVDSAPGKSIVPDMPEIFSTRPAFDFLRCGMANFVVWIYDIRLRSIASLHCSWVRLSSRSEEHTSELQSLRHLVCR